MATIEERLAALEALLGMSEGETPYVSQYSGPDIDEGIELARSGTVRKTGDTMTGNLTIKKSSPAVVFSTEGNPSARIIKNASDTADYGVVVEDTAMDGTKRRLTFQAGQALARTASIIDSDNATYQLYGEHNKPTPAAIGALSDAGGTMTGGLNFRPVGVTGYTQMYKNATSDSADYGTLMIDRDSTGKMIGLKLYAAAQKAIIFDSTSEYDVLHTGNMNSLISSLRIATGTYTGTGTYGGSVTLTCGFKPAFAIIYRSDTVIGATRVPIDTNVSGATTVYGDWSGDFAILVPTAKGIRVSYNNTVTVESGDTYLKFTPSGTELNGAITYNYIIVGS